MELLANKLTNYICKQSNIKNKEDTEKINYALIAILSESFKTIFLIILFLVIGKIEFFFFSFLILFFIRIFSGGIHFNSSIKCLMFSTLVFLVTSFWAPMIPKLTKYFYYSTALLSILIICIKSPCPSKKRPIKSKKREWYLKLISTLTTMFWVYILIFHVTDPRLFNCGFVTIIVQALQLVLVKRKGNNYGKNCIK